MKRLPLLVSFLLFIALCASLAYWAMQLFKPPIRPVAAPPQAAQAEVRPEVAGSLFGGGTKAAVASNYQLRGVIMSGTGRESVAILSAEGKPAQAIRVNSEVLPGVKVKEVHRDYVLLNEGGVTKRVELPESAKGQADIAAASPLARPSTPIAPTTPNGRAMPARPGFSRPSPAITPPPPPAVTPQAQAPATGSPNTGPSTGPTGTITPQTGAPGPGGMTATGVTPPNPPPTPEPGPTVTTIPGASPTPPGSSGSR